MKQAFEYLFHPVKTIEKIIDKNSSKNLLFFSFLLGLNVLLGCSILGKLFLKNIFTFVFGIFFLVLFSIVIGYVLIHIFTWVISGAGAWIGHRAKIKKIRAAFAYSLTPLIGIIFTKLVLMLVLKGKYYPIIGQDLSLTEAFILYTMIVVQIFFYIWAFVLLVQSLAFVKRTNIGKAILNLIFAGLIIALIVFLVTLPFVDRCSNFFDFPELTNNKLYENWEETLLF